MLGRCLAFVRQVVGADRLLEVHFIFGRGRDLVFICMPNCIYFVYRLCCIMSAYGGEGDSVCNCHLLYSRWV